MSFREKSAWLMAALMAVAGLYYLHSVRTVTLAIGETAPPVPVLIGYVVLVVIASVFVQTVLALASPREANAPADERERLVRDRAGHWSGYVLAVGAAGSLWHFLVHGDGDMLFHLVVGSLILSQIADYAFQIALLRRSV